MPVLNTPRAGRKQNDYTENLIWSMYNDEDVIWRWGYGVCAMSPEIILSSYNVTRNIFCKSNLIKVHYIELFIEKEFGIAETLRIADLFGRYILGQGFQNFISIIDSENYYMIAVAVSSTSYVNGSAFHDNNLQYANICVFLKNIMQCDWELEVSDNTFFNTKDGTKNYVHGKLA